MSSTATKLPCGVGSGEGENPEEEGWGIGDAGDVLFLHLCQITEGVFFMKIWSAVYCDPSAFMYVQQRTKK